MPRTFKRIDKGDPNTAALFEPNPATILVRVYKGRVLASCALWGPGRYFGLNRFGVGIFTNGKAWINPPPGESAATERELRDALHEFTGARIERFDSRGDPLYCYA